MNLFLSRLVTQNLPRHIVSNSTLGDATSTAVTPRLFKSYNVNYNNDIKTTNEYSYDKPNSRFDHSIDNVDTVNSNEDRDTVTALSDTTHETLLNYDMNLKVDAHFSDTAKDKSDHNTNLQSTSNRQTRPVVNNSNDSDSFLGIEKNLQNEIADNSTNSNNIATKKIAKKFALSKPKSDANSNSDFNIASSTILQQDIPTPLVTRSDSIIESNEINDNSNIAAGNNVQQSGAFESNSNLPDIIQSTKLAPIKKSTITPVSQNTVDSSTLPIKTAVTSSVKKNAVNLENSELDLSTSTITTNRTQTNNSVIPVLKADHFSSNRSNNSTDSTQSIITGKRQLNRSRNNSVNNVLITPRIAKLSQQINHDESSVTQYLSSSKRNTTQQMVGNDNRTSVATRQQNQVISTPTVTISIGRIEIRASTPTPVTATTHRPAAARGPKMSLSDYLSKHNGGSR